MQTIVEKLFEHVREIDAGISVGEDALEKTPVDQLESLALALGHLHDRVSAVIRVKQYPCQGEYHDKPGEMTNGKRLLAY